MKVQLINIAGDSLGDFKKRFEISSFALPKSLDEYDVNIIDLSAQNGIWQSEENVKNSIDIINDFFSVKTMVERRNKSNIIYVLPRNVQFKWKYYNYGMGNHGYENSMPLKDNIDNVRNCILPAILPDYDYGVPLVFENTRTSIGNCTYEADFYFPEESECITKSNGSEKCTTIKWEEGIYLTTLDITKDVDSLITYLDFLFHGKNKEQEPDWIKNIEFADDKIQKEIIARSQIVIEDEKRKIALANQKIIDNAKYKSILYTNGEQLVKVVFEILEQILNCDLSEFVDLKKEDFLVKKNEVTFIGEIKGVNSNVKYEHISQVEIHYRRYLDSLEDEQEGNINQILIINPFRNKEISQREPINEQQIKLAERNGCLIVCTYTLLQLYEKFLNGETTNEKCISLFMNQKGLLKMEDIK